MNRRTAGPNQLTVDEARAIIKRIGKSSPERVVVARPAPTARGPRWGNQAVPIRAGADDYRDIPSRYGDFRVEYKGARPVTTTVTATNFSSGVK